MCYSRLYNLHSTQKELDEMPVETFQALESEETQLAQERAISEEEKA